jgi:hypothetical protein
MPRRVLDRTRHAHLQFSTCELRSPQPSTAELFLEKRKIQITMEKQMLTPPFSPFFCRIWRPQSLKKAQLNRYCLE